MITNLHIKNFKSFGKPINANISDLTIIAGANSGGKSTIIQMILLLSQTLENPRPDVALDLGGRYVQFAEFREAVFGRPKNADAEFTVGFEFIVQENDLRDFRAIILSKTQQAQLPSEELVRTSFNHYHVEIGFKVNPSGIPIVKSCNYKKSVNGIGVFSFDIQQKQGRNYLANYSFRPNKKSNKLIKRIELIKQKLEKFNLENEKSASVTKHLQDSIKQALNNIPHLQLNDLNKFNIRTSLRRLSKSQNAFFDEILNELQSILLVSPVSISTTAQVHFEHFLFNPIMISEFDNRIIPERFNEHFRISNLEIKRFLRSIQYIGPLRAKPERAYLSAGTPIEIGNAGENAIPILWVNQNEKVFSKTRIGETPKETKLSEATEQWAKEFGIASSFHITKPKRVIYQAELESNPGSKVMVTIADVGFGVSQLLPVIVTGLWARNGSTIILEQPEIHLHPRLQGKLADFLICMAELGKNIIVETHSEHLINMLRLRIVQDTSNEIKKKIGILFVRPPKQSKRITRLQGSRIENLKVDEYGKIINWPSDFFPETGDLTENILKARFEKVSKGE